MTSEDCSDDEQEPQLNIYDSIDFARASKYKSELPNPYQAFLRD